jgi:SAM-dependent MidA family methyltransferase
MVIAMHDEFASVTRNDALLDVIRAEIAAAGPVSFARFMVLALYHPTLGYYRSGKRRIGERGDYLTSPALGPLFGAIVGRQLAEVWERLDRPAAFDLVEIGADDARLTRDVLAWAARTNAAFAGALRPLLVEPDPETRSRQARTLAHLPAQPRWAASLAEIAPASITGCVLSNELIDAFPVRLFVMQGGLPREVRVSADAARRLVEVEDEAPASGLPEHVARLVAALPEGARFEVNEDAPRWLGEVAAALGRGLVLTFDYGYPAADLYASWRTAGTLMAFYRHAVSADPLANVGEQDLTAHVDFTALALAGRAHGLTLAGFTSQREFLTALGIHEAVAAAGMDLAETLARRRAVVSLMDPAGLGRVRVLTQARGLDASGLAGFAGARPAAEALLAGVAHPGNPRASGDDGGT